MCRTSNFVLIFRHKGISTLNFAGTFHELDTFFEKSINEFVRIYTLVVTVYKRGRGRKRMDVGRADAEGGTLQGI